MASFRSSSSVSRGTLLIAVVWASLFAAPAFAQVTGKAVGTVSDSDTGQPLVGAPVVIEGTIPGNVSGLKKTGFPAVIP
jgi:hypothetical protein